MQRFSGGRAILAMFATANVLDVLSTWLAMQVGLAEYNLLPVSLLNFGGLGAVFTFKTLGILVIMAFVVRWSRFYPRLWLGLRLSTWVMSLIVISNVAQTLAACT